MYTRKKPRIESVDFIYTGDEKSFTQFLRATVRDYLSEEKKVSVTMPKPIKTKFKKKAA